MDKETNPLPGREPRQTFDYNPELTQLHEALHHLRRAAEILAANGYIMTAQGVNIITDGINDIVSDNT
jgi:hypothetical protein